MTYRPMQRLFDLGAEDVGPWTGWQVLPDVAGLSFCVTDNSPQPTRCRDRG